MAVFWSRWAHDPRTTASQDDYLDDCRTGRLPQVAWLIPSFTNGLDEHPPGAVEGEVVDGDEVAVVVGGHDQAGVAQRPSGDRVVGVLVRVRQGTAAQRTGERDHGAVRLEAENFPYVPAGTITAPAFPESDKSRSVEKSPAL